MRSSFVFWQRRPKLLGVTYTCKLGQIRLHTAQIRVWGCSNSHSGQGGKGAGRGRGVYQEEIRRGEGRSEEGAAARPAVDAGKRSRVRGDVVGRANKRFVFLFLEKKEDR
jgi:hypothetical protein